MICLHILNSIHFMLSFGCYFDCFMYRLKCFTRPFSRLVGVCQFLCLGYDCCCIRTNSLKKILKFGGREWVKRLSDVSGIVLVGLVGSLMANVNTIPSWKTAWLVLSWMDFSITSVVFDSEYSFLLCHSHNNRHGLPCHHRVSSRLIPLLLHIQVSSSRNSSPISSSPISSSLITNRR